MHLRFSKIILIFLCIFSEFNINRKQRFPTSRAFLIFKTNSLTGRSCTCQTSYYCYCCENVIIIYTKMTKQLCVNFTYETNGLNVNITLNAIALTNRTVTEYKPFKICSKVPGSLFSKVCANILELNRFPRSITACLRTEITTKHKLWELTYNCISISTELPMTISTSTQSSGMPAGQMPSMPGMPGMTPGQMPGMTGMPGMPGMTPGQMMGMPGMPTGQMPAMPGMTPGQMMGMPGMPAGQMPAMPGMPGMPGMTPGQMMGMSGMPAGQMPAMPGMTPGQMMGMPGMPAGQMPAMPGMPAGQMPAMPGMPAGQMMGMPPG